MDKNLNVKKRLKTVAKNIGKRLFLFYEYRKLGCH